MIDKTETKNIGLRGITVADTKISNIDVDLGRLYYRGYSIFDLAKHATYEETAYLLLCGKLPTAAQLKTFSNNLAKNRGVTDAYLHSISDRPATALPMDILQAAVSMLADYDPDIRDESKDANFRRATLIIAKLPTVVAAAERIKNKLPVIQPDPKLSHAANFLYMLTGKKPDPQVAKDFDICLTLHADHTFNASTFSARQVASTRAHMYAAVSAAVGALSGELHGGANEKVMNMLIKIGSPSKAAAYVKNELDNKRVIFGMGHAVYKTIDPRVTVLQPMSQRLAKVTGVTKWLDIAERVKTATQKEIHAKKGTDIHPNVDFVSAVVYYTMGIPVPLYTPVFAIARAAGWCSHVIEEKFAEAQPKPMLYRPQADYTGDFCSVDGCDFIPVKKRKPSAAKKSC